RILRRSGAVVQPIVANDVRNPQAIVGKDRPAPRFLDPAVLGDVAPLPDGFLVTPEGKGQDLSGMREAFETLYGKKPVDFGKVRAQVFGRVQVSLLAVCMRLYFKDDGNHRGAPISHVATIRAGATAMVRRASNYPSVIPSRRRGISAVARARSLASLGM